MHKIIALLYIIVYYCILLPIIANIHYNLFYEDNVYMISEMLNNLGIYNDIDENGMDINKHIEQGISFRNYSNNYLNSTENDHSLLSNSFFPELFDDIEGTKPLMEGLTTSMPIDTNYNKLFNEYRTLYNTYNSELRTPTATKTVTATQLSTKYNELIAAAQTLITDISTLRSAGTTTTLSAQATIQQIQTKLTELSQQHIAANPTNSNAQKIADTLNGQMETVTLKMTSIYYFYIVYFLVAVTILGMTFNLLVNPNADVIKSVYVVGGILAIYVIAKYIGK